MRFMGNYSHNSLVVMLWFFFFFAQFGPNFSCRTDGLMCWWGTSFHDDSSPCSFFSLGFCCLRYSLSMQSVMVIFLMYSLLFVVFFWIVVQTLTSPWPPSFCLAYSLKVLDLGWNPPCKVMSFLVLMSVASIAFFGQLIIPAVYLITGRAVILIW